MGCIDVKVEMCMISSNCASYVASGPACFARSAEEIFAGRIFHNTAEGPGYQLARPTAYAYAGRAHIDVRAMYESVLSK